MIPWVWYPLEGKQTQWVEEQVVVEPKVQGF
jgi:hypothetical protein